MSPFDGGPHLKLELDIFDEGYLDDSTVHEVMPLGLLPPDFDDRPTGIFRVMECDLSNEPTILEWPPAPRRPVQR
jgi:hypothetical protein